MIIDSRASANLIDKQTWEWLKRNKVKCKSARSDNKLYAYASQTPLDVITFSCEVSVGRSTINAEFCVINGKRESLHWKGHCNEPFCVKDWDRHCCSKHRLTNYW